MELWVIFAITSALIFGIKDVFAKKILKKDVSPNQIIFEQEIIVLLGILLFFLPTVQFISFSELWFWYLLKSMSVFGASILYFNLLKKYEISLVTPLLNLSPLILLILSSLYLNESITIIQFMGILVIILAVYYLEVVLNHHDHNKPHSFHFNQIKKTNLSFLFSSVSMLVIISIAAISDKILLSHISVQTNFFFTAFIGLIILLVYYIKEKELIKRFENIVKEPQTLVISGLSVISNVFILLAIAIPTALISLIIPLRRTSTLFSSIIGGIIFHEKHLTKKFVAILFMLVGVLLIVL